MIMAAMVTSIITATADGENDSSLVIITVMNVAKNCKADCFTRSVHIFLLKRAYLQARPDYFW